MELIGLAVLIALIIGVLLWGQGQSKEKLLLEIRDAYRLGDGEDGDVLLGVARTRFSSTRGRLRLIDALFESRAWPQAMQVVTDGLEAAPGHPKLLRYRARIAGETLSDRAVEWMRDWLHDHPNDDRVLLDLALVYHRLRWHEQLLGLLGPYVHAHPDSREARSLLGRAHFAEGELDEARVHLMEAQRLRSVADRHQVAGYQFIAGAEFEVTREERVHAEDDERLLQQIADGTARGRTAVDLSAPAEQCEVVEVVQRKKP